MPYKLKEIKGKNTGWIISSPNHPKGFSKKPMGLRQAKMQLRAIYANTKGK